MPKIAALLFTQLNEGGDMRITFTKALMLSLLAFTVMTFVSPARAHALSTSTIIAMTNQERAAAGLNPLSVNADLMSSAQAKAQDMIARDYWAHFAPDGTSPWYFMTQSGYKYVGAGENLAMDFATDQDVMTGWMNSPGHRANILNPAYVDVGIAVVEGQLQGHDTMLVVAHYGTPAQAPAPAPAPVETPAALVSATPAPAQAPAPVPAVLGQASPTSKPAAAHKVSHKKTESNTNGKTLTFLKIGLAQMWLVPLIKYRGLV
jgi:hypothetical protein